MGAAGAKGRPSEGEPPRAKYSHRVGLTFSWEKSTDALRAVGVPALVIRLPVDAPGELYFDVGSHADILRLRNWLRDSGYLEGLADIGPLVLGRLDAAPEATA